ncbi:MAG: protein BatD [Verrucomicrobiae bacterium]|nr:protein BatD [Verrucomicrobiae bacterium]
MLRANLTPKALRSALLSGRGFFAFLRLAAFAVFAAAPFASAATVTAALDRAEVSLGETAHLILTLQGASSLSSPHIPPVDGLQFGATSHSSNFQFMNGAMSSSALLSLELIPLRAGEFTIPEIVLQVGKETLRTTPLHLRVVAAASTAALPAPPSSAPSATRPTAPAAVGVSDPDASKGSLAFFQIVFPKRPFYVGEVLPVQARLYLHQNLKVRQVSVPAFDGDAFTVAPMPQNPAQTTESVHGVGYNVLTWATTASAVRSGEHSLGGRVQIVVLQRTQNRARDVFGGGFFDEFFGGVEAKNVALAATPVSLEILPLPTEGRPSSFSGAVGRFELSSDADPHQVAAGDPVTLRFTICGTGNLDRLQPPRLVDSAAWKTYPPSARVAAANPPSTEAEKQFEQVVIPLNTSVAAIPETPWSYFDPEAKRYVTLTPPAIPLKVLSSAAPAATGAPPITPSPDAAAAPMSEEERALAEAGSWSRQAAGRLLLLVRKPVFWMALLIPLAGIAAGRRTWDALERRRQNPHHLRRVAASRAVRRALVEMDAARTHGDSAAFFMAVGRALREQLAARFHLNAASLVLADVEPQLGEDRTLLDDIRALFQAADAAAFSGAASDAEALAAWSARLESCLQRIKVR